MPSASRQILKSMVAASSGIFGSRISGLIRDIVFAAYWGTSDALGAFVVAFTIPNLFRRLLGEGALSEGFVPLFTEKLSQNGKVEAFKMLNNVLTIVCLVLGALITVGVAVCLILQQVVEGEMARLTLGMAAALLPYTFFICLVGFLTGVLNVFGRFSLPFLAPVLLNGMLIVGTFFICPYFGQTENRQVYGLTVGVLIAGVLQLGAMWWLLRRQAYELAWVPDWRSREMRELMSLVLPAFAGAGIYQVNVLCDRLLAGWLGGYAVTSLYYSERLIYLPIGVFAVALSAACLPVMSRAAAANDEAGMMDALVYSLRQILFLTLPCVMVLMLLGEQIISLVFERGSFGAESRSATLAALLFYAPGIPAFAAVKILRSGFYSRKDTKTPVKISVFCMGINVILNLSFMWTMQQRGLALATVLSTFLNVFLLMRLLPRSSEQITSHLAPLWHSLWRLLVAISVSAAAVYLVGQVALTETAWPLLDRVLVVGLPAAAGGIAYLGCLFVLRSPEVVELRSLLQRKLRR